MSADATRIERVEVEYTVRGYIKKGTTAELVNLVVVSNEKETRDLMHALASALGYVAITKEQHVKAFNGGKL